jgi:hypothetical protein
MVNLLNSMVCEVSANGWNFLCLQSQDSQCLLP